MADFVEFKEEKIKVKFFQIGKYKFSSIEIYHLAIAMVMIILTLFVFQYKELLNLEFITSPTFFLLLGMYAVTVGFGFLFHELGHKLVAQHYGYISEFRADFQMLGLMFLGALFLPIILLSPGAVMILGRPTIRQNGIISVAGPLVNLALATIFTILGLLFGTEGFLGKIIITGIFVNAFLGIFNMLPIWVLDGKKVLRWSKSIYAIVMISLIFFLLIGFGIIPIL